ncbi:Hypp2133 [Branchiostoma lanceolatum]|uniref:Hypp2133 protein n=1 Tax=Branchiostoma lanceolatum TaxID=7740 RepID=A0A8J9ZRV8_BRALA|nr:Hypp2133 [Branchiostoma lanceolatum]
MASTEDLVPVSSRRCPSCCSFGPNWVTKWLGRRLEKPLGGQAVVAILVFVTACVAVASFQSFQDAMSCEDKSEALLIVFTVFIYLGIPCLAAMAYAIRRDPFMTGDGDEWFGAEGLELSVIFVSIILPAASCVALDVVFFLLVGSCFHRDGSFPTSTTNDNDLVASYRVGLSFHVGRLFFVVAQLALFGWCFATRSFARQKVYTALLFTAVVMANLASWFYEIVDRPSVLCTNDNTCWDTTGTVTKSNTCLDAKNVFTMEFCTFIQFQLYCQPLVGTFALLSLPTMYHMWSKAREGVVENTTEMSPERPNVSGRRGTGLFAKLFLVNVAVLSVTLWVVTHHATTVSSTADYYKVVLYYSFKVLYFSLFIMSTLVGCVRTGAVGFTQHRSRVADILLFLLSAVGLLALIGRVLWGVGSLFSKLSTTDSTYTPQGCTYDITLNPEGDFRLLNAVLIADVLLNLTQLILQTTFLLPAMTHKQHEGSVGLHYGLLCLFNFSVWINGSFFEAQSTTLTTCYTAPVQRAAIGDWNVFLHLLQPVCTFYWLWSFLLMARLLVRRVRVSPGLRTIRGSTETVHALRRPTVSASIELPPRSERRSPTQVTELSHDA